MWFKKFNLDSQLFDKIFDSKIFFDCKIVCMVLFEELFDSMNCFLFFNLGSLRPSHISEHIQPQPWSTHELWCCVFWVKCQWFTWRLPWSPPRSLCLSFCGPSWWGTRGSRWCRYLCVCGGGGSNGVDIEYLSLHQSCHQFINQLSWRSWNITLVMVLCIRDNSWLFNIHTYNLIRSLFSHWYSLQLSIINHLTWCFIDSTDPPACSNHVILLPVSYRQHPPRWSCPAALPLWGSDPVTSLQCQAPWWWWCHRRPCRRGWRLLWTRRFVPHWVGQPGWKNLES